MRAREADGEVMTVVCPFCDTASLKPIVETPCLLAIADRYPVSPGHTLILPRRHVASFFDLTDVERSELLRLVDIVKDRLDAGREPDGYNVGFNEGRTAGQTVLHFHLHVIPRYENDLEDPRGGIRWIFPAKAAYWDRLEPPRS